VARFVAPSAFAARKLAGSGIPAERIRVVPNPVEDPGVTGAPGRGAVFAGRLSPEKGGALLLDAWKSVPEFPLTLVGDGPQAAALRERAKLLPNVRFTGALDREGVRAELARAAFLVAPSLCYETFGLAPAEALAAGRAIVVPRATALSELVDGGRGGLLFDAGDADSLARTCVALAADRGRCEALGAEAREVFEERFAAESRVERLLSVYRNVLSTG
jgi:glycosyltransferase involved in cell wall biosynthesis